ncbi:M14 family metallopeptidase [Fodinibius salinus]|nr:M14 family metallopeptidase [Fodinibius salinus]
MTSPFSKILAHLFIAILFIIAGCSSSDNFSGFSYDPEGVTETTDKGINPQYKRTIGVESGGVWVSNEFAGARMSDFYKVSDSLYRIEISPENKKINNSPWYAFKVWGSDKDSVTLQLHYNHGEHRYIPKLSKDGKTWRRIDPSNFSADTTNGTATLSLDLTLDPLWVSAQELYLWDDYRRWTDSLAAKRFIKTDTVGYSHNRRPIIKMGISETNNDSKKGVLIIMGRQHPSEVTGALAAQIFINELASQSKLANQFRKNFDVWTYPLVNPDGVQQGHWRHNSAGVDLNRDWQAFNQPETRAIRNDLLSLNNDSLRTVYYGIDFHSTDENLFYPINRDISTFPEDFTYQWIDSLTKTFPNYPVKVEPFDTSSPIAKNWIYHTFGADAVTYEINDRANRDSIRIVTRKNAQIIMQQLLNEKEEQKMPAK